MEPSIADSHPAELKRQISETVRMALADQTQQIRAHEEQRQRSIALAVLDEHRRRIDREVEETRELEAVVGKSKRTRKWLFGSAGAIATIAAAIYGYGHQAASDEARQTARSTEVDGKIDDVEREVRAAADGVEKVARDLGRHIESQATINEAIKLRGVRTEVMLETLVRRRGIAPPKKSMRQRAADKAVGIDPDDPLGGL